MEQRGGGARIPAACQEPITGGAEKQEVGPYLFLRTLAFLAPDTRL